MPKQKKSKLQKELQGHGKMRVLNFYGDLTDYNTMLET